MAVGDGVGVLVLVGLGVLVGVLVALTRLAARRFCCRRCFIVR